MFLSPTPTVVWRSCVRSAVAYLRKEKEIVDIRLELSKQESARQETQIEHLSQALEETRATLSNVRSLL